MLRDVFGISIVMTISPHFFRIEVAVKIEQLLLLIHKKEKEKEERSKKEKKKEEKIQRIQLFFFIISRH